MSAALVCEVCGRALHTEGDSDVLDALAYSAGYEHDRCAPCARLDEAAASSRRVEVLAERDSAA